ncbi:MAG: hypothetical protein FJ164_01125 [Gammaproteobacteria bacterium]|nr:hypothetical protein [Gammaproteobacteria bacterium]
MIGVIAKREIRGLLRAPQTWWMLAALQFLVAWQFLAQLELFAQVLPKLRQLPEPPGVSQLVLNPTWQISGFLMLFLAPVLTMQTLSGERRQGLMTLWYSAPVSLPALVLGKYLGVMSLLGVVWGLHALLPLILCWGTAVDLGTASSGLLALLLLMSAATALGLWCSALSQQPVMPAVGGFALLLALWLVDWNAEAEGASGVMSALSALAHFQRMARGQIHAFDVTYFVLLTVAGLSLAMLALAAERHAHRLRRHLLSLFLLAGFIALGSLAAHLRASLDLTATARHTLAPASVQAVQAIAGPLSATVYLPKGHPTLSAVRDLVARYQRHRADLTLTVTDPANVPDLIRAEQLTEGTLVLRAGERTERFTRYHEETFTQALLKLTRAEPEWVAFTTGHGERSPERLANFDLEGWGRVLRSRGYRVQELDLSSLGTVPDNTALLVIASPLLDFAPAEVEAVQAHLARGGALLWLGEPESPASLAPLAETLGVSWHTGTVFEPAGASLGVKDPSLVVLPRHPPHALTQGLRGPVILPVAAALASRSGRDWQGEPLLRSSAESWRESTPSAPGFDAGTETRAAHTLALALTREQSGRRQRIIVVGDGDFVSNTYLGNGANQELGTHMVDWLVANEALVGVETRPAPDVNLELSRMAKGLMGLGLLIMLPAVFVAAGLWLAWRRKRA